MFGPCIPLIGAGGGGGGTPQDTGFVELTVAAQAAPGTISWTDTLTNMLSNQATNIQFRGESGEISLYAKATDASAALAAVGGIVDGVEVELEGTGDDAGADEMYDEHMQLIIDGTIVGDDKADLVTQWGDSVHEIRTYGSPVDKWGLTNAQLLNLANVGSGVAYANMSFDTPASFQLWRIRIRVYYTV